MDPRETSGHRVVDVNLNVERQPRQRKRHRFWDVCAILFAGALIGAAVDSSTAFAFAAAIGIALYVIGNVLFARRTG